MGETKEKEKEKIIMTLNFEVFEKIHERRLSAGMSTSVGGGGGEGDGGGGGGVRRRRSG